MGGAVERVSRVYMLSPWPPSGYELPTAYKTVVERIRHKAPDEYKTKVYLRNLDW
jgi:hypothetical protein